MKLLLVILLLMQADIALANVEFNAELERQVPTFHMRKLLTAIALTESSIDISAIGLAGERGIFQFMPIGYREAGNLCPDLKLVPFENLSTDLSLNVRSSICLVGALRAFYPETDTLRNLMYVYNAGIGTFRKGIIPKSTHKYWLRFKEHLSDIYNFSTPIYNHLMWDRRIYLGTDFIPIPH